MKDKANNPQQPNEPDSLGTFYFDFSGGASPPPSPETKETKVSTAGVDSARIEEAKRLFDEAFELANTHASLPDPVTALKRVIILYEMAAEIYPKGSMDFGRCHLNRSSSLITLARFQRDPALLFEEAVSCCDFAIPCFTEGSNGLGLSYYNRARALTALAPLQRDPTPLLEEAIRSCELAIPCLPEGSFVVGTCQLARASAFLDLAPLQRDPVPLLKEAICNCELAIPCFPEGSNDVGRSQNERAKALLYLAPLQRDPAPLLEEAIFGFDLAIPCCTKGNRDFGVAHLNRGLTFKALAPYHHNPFDLFRLALEDFERTDPCFNEPQDRLKIHSARSSLLLRLADMSPMAEVSLGWLMGARDDAQAGVKLLETTISSFRREESRRLMRNEHHHIFLILAEACLCLADYQTDTKEATRLRQEAWQAISLSKGRSLREGLRRQLALDEKDIFQSNWEQLLARFGQLNRLGGGRADTLPPTATRNHLDETERAAGADSDAGSLLLDHWHQGTLTLEVPPAEVPAFDTWMGDLAALRPQGTSVIAEFVGFSDGSCRVLLHQAGDMGLIAKPVVLPKGLEHGAELSQHLQAALEWMSHKGARNGSIRRLPGGNLRTAPPRAPYTGKAFSAAEEASSQTLQQQFENLLQEARDIGRWNELAGALAGWHADPETKQAAHGFCRRLAEILFECVSEMPREDHRSNSDWRQSAGILGAVTPEMAYGAGITPAQFQAFDDEAKAIMLHVPHALGELLAPLRNAIAQRPEWTGVLLVLCPTGPFHLLPIAAAQWGDRQKSLIDCHPVVTLPTACYAEEVVKRREKINSNTPAKRRAFLAATDPSGILKNIHKEVNVAGDRLRQSGFDVECVKDSKAKAQCMRNQEEADVVHLAMHSGIDPQFELSGLEFHDRRLTVVELLTRVRLRRAKLAIVATCSSWQVHGDDIGADDPLALARCWSIAGANSVIGTLWPLQDDAAMMFSHTLYECMLEEGLPLARAVRRAIVTLKKHQLFKNNPYAWAPFLLVGDPATML